MLVMFSRATRILGVGVGWGVGGWGWGWGGGVVGVSPMFTRQFVSQSLCPPPNDVWSYVSHVPKSLEMFPSHVPPKTYITQSLFSPVPMLPLIHSPYFSQSLRSPF